MTKPLITLPCTARELENALHAVCDYDGLWDAKVFLKTEYPYGIDFPTRLLNIESKAEMPRETKGEAK